MEHSKMPIGSAEDVEFADELADEDDKEALQRAEAAEQRVGASEGE
ncbi:YfhD family protein [Cohnella sp. NL03-T5]|nr:YfhD family protein [Cohnella silvisoli]